MNKCNIGPLKSILYLLPRSHPKTSPAMSAASATPVWLESNYSFNVVQGLQRRQAAGPQYRIVVAKAGAACCTHEWQSRRHFQGSCAAAVRMRGHRPGAAIWAREFGREPIQFPPSLGKRIPVAVRGEPFWRCFWPQRIAPGQFMSLSFFHSYIRETVQRRFCHVYDAIQSMNNQIIALN